MLFVCSCDSPVPVPTSLVFRFSPCSHPSLWAPSLGDILKICEMKELHEFWRASHWAMEKLGLGSKQRVVGPLGFRQALDDDLCTFEVRGVLPLGYFPGEDRASASKAGLPASGSGSCNKPATNPPAQCRLMARDCSSDIPNEQFKGCQPTGRSKMLRYGFCSPTPHF